MLSPTAQKLLREPPKRSNRAIKLCKKDPAETAKQVRAIFKSKPDAELAATKLAPIYGLGDEHAVIARLRAEAVFRSPELEEPFAELSIMFLRGRWDVPLPEWQPVMKEIGKHERDPFWRHATCPTTVNLDDVGQSYARCLIRFMHGIRHPAKNTDLLHWIKDANAEDGYWILFHAVMYLQLEAMLYNKMHAPLKDRFLHVRDNVCHFLEHFRGKSMCEDLH